MLRAAIEQSGVTRYRIAKADRDYPANLGRFCAGETSLRLDKADGLAAYLGLRLVPDPDADTAGTDAGKPGPADTGEAKQAKRKAN